MATAVRSQPTWPFIADVAKQVARSQESWPIRKSARRGHRTGPAARHTVIRCLRAWCQAAGKEHTQ